jgi:competence protein ComEC
MGDLEEDRDGQLVDALGGPDGPWDLLKVAHHGSATATSETLLDAIQPRLAAISAGADNEYGHPAPELLERLQRSGTVTWRTDEQGTLSITLDGRRGGADGHG